MIAMKNSIAIPSSTLGPISSIRPPRDDSNFEIDELEIQRAHISVHQQIRAFSMPHLRLMRQQEGQKAHFDHLARRSTEKEFAPRHLTVCPHHQQVRVFLAGGGYQLLTRHGAGD